MPDEASGQRSIANDVNRRQIPTTPQRQQDVAGRTTYGCVTLGMLASHLEAVCLARPHRPLAGDVGAVDRAGFGVLLLLHAVRSAIAANALTVLLRIRGGYG